jgi:hypothetical protein
MTGETDSEITAVQYQALRTKYRAKNIYYRQKQRANADNVINLMRK